MFTAAGPDESNLNHPLRPEHYNARDQAQKAWEVWKDWLTQQKISSDALKQMIMIMYWKVHKSPPVVLSFVNSCTSRQMILRLTFIVLVTMFGKPYKPCRHYSKTANNGLHMSINLFPIFPDFMAMFPLVTIFGNVHRPHQQYSNIVNDSLDHVYYIFPFFSWFSTYICINDYIWKYAQTM